MFRWIAGAIAVLLIAIGFYLFTSEESDKRTIANMPEHECLARNLAYETLRDSHDLKKKPEGRHELEAIIRVVFERKRLGRRGGYRDSVCGVVYQRNQFSWTRKKELWFKIPVNARRWQFMQTVAKDALRGEFKYPWPKTYACIDSYKHARDKGVGKRSKKWFEKEKSFVVTIGDHSFFCPK